MPDDSQDKLTRDVVAAFAHTPDPRLRQLMTSLVEHIHAFARENDLRPEEWAGALAFLAETGQVSVAQRSELTILSDTLGLSMMVVALAEARAGRDVAGGDGGNQATEATEATVEGPFFRAGAPEFGLGDDIAEGMPGEPAFYSGRVTDLGGRPLAGTVIDVWSSDGEGRYDVQLGSAPSMRARGRLRTDAEGGYRFWSVLPACYPIPDDGPVGRMMRATRRSIWRPAHVHMMLTAEGHQPLTTHLFIAGSPYLDSDAVFARRDSLVVEFHRHPPGTAPDGRVMNGAYHSASYDFRLAPVRSSRPS